MRSYIAVPHRHLFTFHRHPDNPVHPRPDRWHVHIWLTHVHVHLIGRLSHGWRVSAEDPM